MVEVELMARCHLFGFENALGVCGAWSVVCAIVKVYVLVYLVDASSLIISESWF